MALTTSLAQLKMISWRRWRRVMVLVSAVAVAFITFHVLSKPTISANGSAELQRRYPLLWKYVHTFNGNGGAWYIPPDWSSESSPTTIIDAAQLAFRATNSSANRNIAYSSIPLIIHETWKNTHIDTWSDEIRECTEKWLAYAVHEGMAYFLWDDDGVSQLLNFYDPGLKEQYSALQRNVEKADVFRVLVAKWIGGIVSKRNGPYGWNANEDSYTRYGDIDTEPLQSPAKWVHARDIEPWVDDETGDTYKSTSSVKAIVGIEADCPPDTDAYWRMGYHYPIQLTQWAFAFAPNHPILSRFMDNLLAEFSNIADHSGGTLKSESAQKALHDLDAIVFTGPAAFTVATESWLNESAGLRWNAVSGLKDEGRAKFVDDVLVLPITGFSPGRGIYGNMGSKPVTDPDARLRHRAQGSWKNFDLRVEYGKFCRSFFGLCRDWSKVPS